MVRAAFANFDHLALYPIIVFAPAGLPDPWMIVFVLGPSEAGDHAIALSFESCGPWHDDAVSRLPVGARSVGLLNAVGHGCGPLICWAAKSA